MNNGDMPANPIRGANNTIFTKNDAGAIEGCGLLVGLTKREAFAMAAMQGILSSKYYGEFCTESESESKALSCANAAVNHADALLKELDK